MLPETRYVRLGDERIAYQTIGEGPIDLVVTWGSFGNVDIEWEDPVSAEFYRRLASFARVIRFDRRGTSSSDRLSLDELPPWESYVEEMTAVLDAVGSTKTAVMGVFDGGPAAALFAATKPERTRALILGNTSSRFLAGPDYPIGIPPDVLDAVASVMEETWGSEEQVWVQVPSRRDDEAFRRWYAKFLRAIASPRAVAAFFRALVHLDARSILPSIHVPTLVLHRSDYAFLPVEHGRYLAEHIAGATFVEIPGRDASFVWEGADLVIDTVQEFLTGARAASPTDRVLATVLFTDIADSTVRAREVGDRRWRELLELHDEVSRRAVTREHGTLVKTTGDGILATFDGPGRSMRCAMALREELLRAGLTIREGIHTGEVELRDGDVAGIAVHIAARVMAAASPGEILVSRTVRDLTVGSDIALIDRGSHALKGVEGDWQLFAVA